MALKHNLVANYLGQGWIVIISLAFIPLYIKYLGIESYGLIGLFTLLQVCLGLLDIGITPALGREMSKFTGGTHSVQSIRDLLRSIEFIVFAVAVCVASGIALSANWIATSWLQAESLPVDVITKAFMLMGLVTAIRFMESIYRSSIIGLQHHVFYNVFNSAIATLRGLGAVGVLVWISASIEAFFIWQGVVSIISLIIFMILTYTNLPRAERRGKFSLVALRGVWKFAVGMAGITLLSLLLTQVDKILLSKLLSLKEYGYYTLVTIVAGGLYAIITPITQSFYPRLCELHARNDHVGLINTYHKGAQLISVFGGSVAIVIILFSETFLRLWTQDSELAQRTKTLLSLLMLGNLLNGLMWIPYQTQLAHSWTSLTIRINIIAIAIIVPAILWVTPRFGVEGAAWVWVSLNAGYFLISIHFMYRRILITEKWRWYIKDVLIPLLSGIAVASFLSLLWCAEKNILNDTVLLILAASITLTVMLFSAHHTRQQINYLWQSYWIKRKTKNSYDL
jgi:O-antigen/teichoic acid export membrane protein